MAKFTVVLVIGILAIFILLPTTVQAQPNVCGFYGTVTLDGVPVEDGTVIKIWIDREYVTSTTTYTNTDVDPPIPSYYSITIDGIDNDFEGRFVEFTIGQADSMVIERGTFENGANKSLNLTAASLGGCFADVFLKPETGFATNVCGYWYEA
ncbi:hypothetical protein ACFLU3_03940 [Chloroflexota bacterium]